MRDKFMFTLGISFISLIGLLLCFVTNGNILLNLVIINITLLIELLFVTFFLYYQNKNKKENDLFLQSIIHDIKTPVYSIVNLLECEKKNMSNSNFNKIRSSTKNLLNTVNDFLEVSKLQYKKNSLKNERFYLGDLINEVKEILAPLSEEKSIKFNVYNNNVLHENIICDKEKVTKVLINVISNSIKYTKELGSVKLIISEEIKEGKTCIIFTIKDNGIGMSKEFIEKIFIPFSREKKKYVNKNNGAGLGMFIISKLLKIMKGKIEINSKENIGSMFTITIPVITCVENDYNSLKNKKIIYYDEDIIDYHYSFNTLKTLSENVIYCKDSNLLDELLDECDYLLVKNYDSLESINHKVKTFNIDNLIFRKDIYKVLLNKEVKKNSFVGKRILIADDNEINLEITTDIIKDKGIIVDTAIDGLSLLKKFLSSKINYYDAIMTDIHMPVIDGFDVCDKIRSLDREDARNIPIIVVSAANNEYDKKIFDSLKITDYIDKPININSLTKILTKYLNR